MVWCGGLLHSVQRWFWQIIAPSKVVWWFWGGRCDKLWWHHVVEEGMGETTHFATPQ